MCNRLSCCEQGKRIPDVSRFHVLITTYEVIISDLELLRQVDWRSAIIDEAHRLKNRNCKLLQGLNCFDVVMILSTLHINVYIAITSSSSCSLTTLRGDKDH